MDRNVGLEVSFRRGTKSGGSFEVEQNVEGGQASGEERKVRG